MLIPLDSGDLCLNDTSHTCIVGPEWLSDLGTTLVAFVILARVSPGECSIYLPCDITGCVGSVQCVGRFAHHLWNFLGHSLQMYM